MAYPCTEKIDVLPKAPRGVEEILRDAEIHAAGARCYEEGVSASSARQHRLLQLIPKAPRKITVEQVQRLLGSEDIRVTSRTVRRDLDELATVHPLVCDAMARPQGWSWARDAAPLLPPTLDPHTALAITLAATHAAPVLPPQTLAHLGPYLAQAQRILQNGPSAALRRWQEKIRVLPPGLPFAPARIDGQVFDVVQQALSEERCFRASYRNARQQTKQHTVHPLGLVWRPPQIYLVCTVRDGQPPIQLALARIRSAELVDRPWQAPDGFDLDEFLRRGELDVPLAAEPIALRLRVRAEAGGFLFDSCFADDQRVTPDGEEWLLVEATVRSTRALRSWILGLAPHVEVLGPAQLREEIRVAASRLFERHGAGSQVTSGVTTLS
jgi:predicted DNA-binding transcriptional regulator YafY